MPFWHWIALKASRLAARVENSKKSRVIFAWSPERAITAVEWKLWKAWKSAAACGNWGGRLLPSRSTRHTALNWECFKLLVPASFCEAVLVFLSGAPAQPFKPKKLILKFAEIRMCQICLGLRRTAAWDLWCWSSCKVTGTVSLDQALLTETALSGTAKSCQGPNGRFLSKVYVWQNEPCLSYMCIFLTRCLHIWGEIFQRQGIKLPDHFSKSNARSKEV